LPRIILFYLLRWSIFTACKRRHQLFNAATIAESPHALHFAPALTTVLPFWGSALAVILSFVPLFFAVRLIFFNYELSPLYGFFLLVLSLMYLAGGLRRLYLARKT
jgi:hypothetical protein